MSELRLNLQCATVGLEKDDSGNCLCLRILLRLWRFSPFPGHGLPFFFPQSLLCFAAVRQFLALNNLVSSFRTSSLKLFLGFQAGLLPPRLPYRIRFGTLLSKIVTTRRHDIMSRTNSGNCLYHSRQNHPKFPVFSLEI